MANTEDEVKITMPVELDVKKGQSQFDTLVDYILKESDRLQDKFKKVGLLDKSELKQIVKLGKEFYKIAFTKTGEVSSGVLTAISGKKLGRPEFIEQIKLSAQEIESLYVSIGKLSKGRQLSALKELAGGDPEKLKLLQKQARYREKIEEIKAQYQGSELVYEDKMYKTYETKLQNVNAELRSIEKKGTKTHNLSKEQEKLNKKLEEYKVLIAETMFTSDKDVGKMQSKLMTEELSARAKGLDTSGFSEPLKQLKDKKEMYAQIGAELRTLVGEQLSKQDQLKIQLADAQERLSLLKDEFVKLRASGKDVSVVTEELKNVSSEVRNLKKDLKPSWFQKLVNTFKRVGFYRLSRRLFQIVEQGLRNSIQNLAKFSPEFNDTMSSITSQFTILSNSVATILVPLLKTVEPIFKGLTNVITRVTSALSYLIAKLTGSATYLKVNTEYLKEFNQESQNLSFDKFESLNAMDDSSDMFEELSTSGGLSDGLKESLVTLSEISAILLSIGSFKIFKWISSGDAAKFFSDLKKSLTDVKGKIGDISKAGLIAGASFAFVTSLINLIDVIKNWDSQSLVTKITAITSAALALAAVVFSILAAIPAIGHTAVFKALSIGLGAAATLTGAISIMKFAEGGVPDKGSLFVAGESGAEFVTKMPSGQTGVTNIAQFKEAMIEALYEASNAGVFGGEAGDVALYLDGAEIARSKRFKAELNRTNSNLNLK